MNSIWNKNYQAFKTRFPKLAELTGSKAVPPETVWSLENARNGMLTASENGVRLHSAYNPEREAAGAVGRDEVFSKSAVVFYGFGLGYHVIEFAKTAATRLTSGHSVPRLILIEPDVNHFFAALSLLDWSSVFALENLVLALGCPAESVLPLLEDSTQVNVGETGVSDSYFFDIPSFTAHAAGYFNDIRSIVKRNQRKNEINAATLKKFGRLWCRNSLKNAGQLKKLAGIAGLESCAAQNAVPFIIIGAGPSLEKILPYIKELQERTVTLCVETALHTLLRAGVQPDFILLTDPQFWAYRHIAGLSAPRSFLITELSAYPAVFRFNCRRLLLCASQFPIGQYLEKKLSITAGDLGTGGSVASSAWNFAHFCGAREIFTAGLDLAFPEKQTHIRGSSAEQTYHTLASRLTTPDKFTAASLYSANAIAAKDYKGNPLLTDSRMKMFAWWFESRLAACPETKTYTLCPQGLAVPGIQPAEITDLLARPSIKDFKAELLARVQELTPLATGKESKLDELISQFPQTDFLQSFPFLKEYL